MITASLTNDEGTYQLPRLEVPFSEATIENAADVETLDGNIYTDFVRQKRRWTIRYTVLTEEQYFAIREFYDRQFIMYEYPLFSVPFFEIADVPVRMYLNQKDVYKNCGDVQDIVITLRESNQLDGILS